MRRFLDLIRDLFRRPPARSRRTRRLLAELARHTQHIGHAAGRTPVRRSPNTVVHLYSRPARPSINPSMIRDRQFGDRARRGLDPTEVRGFLHLVADELTALRAELRSTQDENDRIKQALRDWQSQQFQQIHQFGAGVAA